MHFIFTNRFAFLFAGVVWILFSHLGITQKYFPFIRTDAESISISEEYNGWSELTSIPISLNNQIPMYPHAVAENGTISLAFQAHASYGMNLSKDIYLMHYSNGSWSTATNISRSPVSSAWPRLALADADSVQTIHLIWGEQTTPESRLKGPPRPMIPNEILYMSNKNGVWSEPYSLFKSHRRTIQFNHRLIRDRRGTLHFVFSAPDPTNNKPRIYYSQRQEQEDLWDTPEPIGTGGEPNLIRLKDSRFLMAYIRADSVWAKEVRGRDVNSIFVKQSSDGGLTWSKDQLIQRSGLKPAYRPHFVVDEKGEIHLFWRQDTDGDRLPDTIIHTSSVDGRLWSDQKKLIDEELQERGYPAYYKMTGALGNTVFAFFILRKGPGASKSKLYYTYLDGDVWRKPQQLFDSITVNTVEPVYDATSKQLHLIVQAGEKGKQGLYHSVYRRKQR